MAVEGAYQEHDDAHAEMLDAFAFLGEKEAYEVVIENTNKLADMIERLKPIPDGFYPPKIEGAEEEVREMT